MADVSAARPVNPESSRTYTFVGGFTATYTGLKEIDVQGDGSHYFVLPDGKRVHIKPTWLALEVTPAPKA
jgi:hypothetical protein